MALLFTEGFDSYAATADMLKKWSTVTSPWAWNSSGGPDGGGCAVCTSSASSVGLVSSGILGSTTRLCVGFFIKISAIVNVQAVFIIKDPANATAMYLRTNLTGAIDGIAASANICMNGSKNVSDNQWHWVEIDINTVTSQPCRMYIDGVLEFSGYLTNMGSVAMYRLYLGSSTGATVSFANVIAWDNSGSGMTVANFPLGPRDVTTIRPNGDGAVQFTRSTGSTNFSLVDEVNGDVSDYVESSTPGQQDLYDYAALAAAPATINGVMLNSYMHTPVPGVISLQQVCKSGSTTSVGTTVVAPSVTPRVLQQAYELDPNGNIPWIAANLDAAQFGVKVV